MGNTPIKCEFCGSALKPRYMDYAPFSGEGGRRQMIVGYEQCDCEEAAAKRECEEQKKQEREAREAIEKRNRQYEKAGIMPYWWNRCQPDHSYQSILQTGKGLYIDGEIGTGKTHLAVCIAMACLESGWSVKLTSMRDITRRLRATWGERGADEEGVFDSLMRPRILILDDLGKESMTETVLRDLFDLVDKRKDMMLPIIVTTNYSKPELVARMSHGLDDTTTAESIVSRLFEITQRVPVNGEDRRLTCN